MIGDIHFDLLVFKDLGTTVVMLNLPFVALHPLLTNRGMERLAPHASRCANPIDATHTKVTTMLIITEMLRRRVHN